MEFTIDGEFEIAKCDKKLRIIYEDYMYMNCLFKRKDNERIIKLYFENMRMSAEKILRINNIVDTMGTIKKTQLKHTVLK